MNQEKSQELLAAEKIVELSPLLGHEPAIDNLPKIVVDLYVALAASHRRIGELENRLAFIERRAFAGDGVRK